MQIQQDEYKRLIVTTDEKEKYYKESTLYYHIKKELLKQGFDVVRQVPEKDGHMTSAPYYIRDRKGKYCWIDDSSAIRELQTELNEKQRVMLDYYSLD